MGHGGLGVLGGGVLEDKVDEETKGRDDRLFKTFEPRFWLSDSSANTGQFFSAPSLSAPD